MPTLKISVKLYAVLQLERFQEKEFNVAEGVTVAEVVADLDLPSEHVDILLVNGVHVTADHVLAEGDVLSVLPMVDGG